MAASMLTRSKKENKQEETMYEEQTGSNGSYIPKFKECSRVLTVEATGSDKPFKVLFEVDFETGRVAVERLRGGNNFIFNKSEPETLQIMGTIFRQIGEEAEKMIAEYKRVNS